MRTRVFGTLSLCLLLSLACTAAGGAKGGVSERTIELDGRTVRVEDAARAEYETALQEREAGELSKARVRLERVRAAYGDASVARYATLALAQVHLDEKAPREAKILLEQLLLEDPSSPDADQARYLLALSQLALGDAKAAAPTLERLVDKMPTEAERKEVAFRLAEELETQGQHGEAARYLSRALQLSPTAERSALEARLLALVDERVSLADVRRLKEVEAKSGTFFDELLTFKLARVHLHLRDYLAAAEAAEAYLGAYPSGRFAADAAALLERLKARVVVEPRTIGVLLPLSGDYKYYGQRALTAIKLGMGLKVDRDDYKGDAGRLEARLSLQGENIRLVVRDSRADPVYAARVVEELIDQEHVIAILGDIATATVKDVALKAEEFGVPIVSLSSREGVAELGPWTFRMAFTAQKQARALAALAMDQMGMKRFALVYPRYPYALTLIDAFWDEVEKRQGEVTAVESYDHDETTFTVLAKRLVGRLHLEARGEYIACKDKARELESDYQRKKALERCTDDVTPIVDFDALLLPDTVKHTSYVVPALVAEDMLVTKDRYTIQAYRKTTENRRVKPVQLLGGALWNDPELTERLGRQVEGALLVDSFSARDGTEKVSKFVEAFKEVHRSAPMHLEAHAYDAGHLFAAILRGQAGEVPKTRAAMRETLGGVQDFPGVTGLVRFDGEGDSATPPRFFTVEKGRLEEADLAALADGDG